MSDTTSTPAPQEKSFGRDVTEQSALALATTAAAVVGMFGAAAAAGSFMEWREKRQAKKSQAQEA